LVFQPYHAKVYVSNKKRERERERKKERREDNSKGGKQKREKGRGEPNKVTCIAN
jgi:hypothetical protein